LNPKNKLSRFVHDTLRSSVLIQRKVITLRDGLEGLDQGSRIANDQVLMTLPERPARFRTAFAWRLESAVSVILLRDDFGAKKTLELPHHIWCILRSSSP